MGRKALCWMAMPWGRSGQCNQEQQRVLVLLILPWSWQTLLAPCVSLGFYFILFGPKILIRMAMGPHGLTLAGGEVHAGDVGSSITDTCCSWHHGWTLKLGIGFCSLFA